MGDRLSAADVQMGYPLEAALERGRVGGLDQVRAWLDRMAARPAYQRAREKGGPAVP